MDEINPLQLTFTRFLIGGLVLLPFAIADLRKRHVTIKVTDFLWLLFLGILNVAISMNMIQYALKFIPASLAAVLFCSNPLYVALFSAWFLKEGLGRRKILGLVIGLIGVVVAFSNGRVLGDFATISGILLTLLSALTFSLYTVLGKKVTIKLGSMSFASATSLLGCLATLPLMLKQGVLPFAYHPVAILPQLIYLSVMVTGVAYFCYFKALESLDTSLGSMTFFMKPLLASFFAAIFLAESITINLFLGMVLVLVGIYIVIHSVDKVKYSTHSLSMK
jgi:drug/metabolite transporter (DMT)-like permease